MTSKSQWTRLDNATKKQQRNGIRRFVSDHLKLEKDIGFVLQASSLHELSPCLGLSPPTLLAMCCGLGQRLVGRALLNALYLHELDTLLALSTPTTLLLDLFHLQDRDTHPINKHMTDWSLLDFINHDNEMDQLIDDYQEHLLNPKPSDESNSKAQIIIQEDTPSQIALYPGSTIAPSFPLGHAELNTQLLHAHGPIVSSNRACSAQQPILSPNPTSSWNTPHDSAMDCNVSPLPFGLSTPQTTPFWTNSSQPLHNPLYSSPSLPSPANHTINQPPTFNPLNQPLTSNPLNQPPTSNPINERRRQPAPTPSRRSKKPPKQSDDTRTVKTSSSFPAHSKFVCSICNQRATCESNLQQHMLTHDGPKIYACEYPACDKAFGRAWGLSRHYKDVHKCLDVKVAKIDGIRRLSTPRTPPNKPTKKQNQPMTNSHGVTQQAITSLNTPFTPDHGMIGYDYTSRASHGPTPPILDDPFTNLTIRINNQGPEHAVLRCQDCGTHGFNQLGLLQHLHLTHGYLPNEWCSCWTCRDVSTSHSNSSAVNGYASLQAQQNGANMTTSGLSRHHTLEERYSYNAYPAMQQQVGIPTNVTATTPDPFDSRGLLEHSQPPHYPPQAELSIENHVSGEHSNSFDDGNSNNNTYYHPDYHHNYNYYHDHTN
jgi:hypothetical protein